MQVLYLLKVFEMLKLHGVNLSLLLGNKNNRDGNAIEGEITCKESAHEGITTTKKTHSSTVGAIEIKNSGIKKHA